MDWFLYFFDIHEVVVLALPQKLLEDVVSQVGLLLLHHFHAFVLQRDILLVHIHYYITHQPHNNCRPRHSPTKDHSLLLVLAHGVHLETEIVALLGVDAHGSHQCLRNAHDWVHWIYGIHGVDEI